ncbi:-trehalose-phosphate synthase (udp-forming) [Plasmopara halstedii]|uniref:alpha,alpha-trehalose-phosphate synthase (UDP-forming) n=1 Tax=Plasmopara halstedii TaxID=4781 RepID=A0A0P1AKT3_PLAHL|nr:-trehalose-phosphate synthase (udp-forming) [Plasmopara halstedii]CEG41552.1 -trehalose-phosphate synthase (udp-forming) [Plasmopara halstedii]|eukprot:XP_024577921.1 -trehalose-phosphate synthase (udp-forming) [Plasmopara halstedii]
MSDQASKVSNSIVDDANRPEPAASSFLVSHVDPLKSNDENDEDVLEGVPDVRDVREESEEDTAEKNAREQELLMSIQELQRQLSMVQIQTDKPEEEIVPPVMDARHRLIMVSNRLPISFQRNETTGEMSFKMSSGGLVTALNGIRDQVPFIWIGWLGEEIPHDEQSKVREKLASEFNCVPVFLTKEIASRYYNDFSNDILWPIFHYVPLPLFRPGSEKKFDFRQWDAYKLANKRFAQAVNQVYRDGDFVWVHDYHLMTLPSLLRARHPQCKIGWFLHTPFPTAEMYRTLPVGREILEGLLGADLLGFHTYDYARLFIAACARVPGASTTPKGVELGDHFTAIGVFPIGIDPEHFEGILKTDATQKRIRELTAKFAGCKIIIGVDRMDYIKGIPHKMLAMERFLSLYPERCKDVVLIQIGVPSRTGVEEYQHLAASVNEMVGRINGRFGTLTHSPVHYIHQSVTPSELVALYNLADVCLVTSLRDGMNLVSHEYVMCQTKSCEPHREGPGVLILSEFAGSAQSLSGAIRVNPWNTTDMAKAIACALELPLMDREYRQTNLYRYVKTHSASFWGKSFLTDLEDLVSRPRAVVKKSVKLPTLEVLGAYTRSSQRLLVLDYEGALSDDLVAAGSQQRSNVAPPKPFVKRLIETLASDSQNTVVLISAHERSAIDSWLKDPRVGVVAESGYFYRLPNDSEWQVMTEDTDPSWQKVVRPIMQYFTERTPGSRIESKESCLTWHYGETDRIFGPMQARDMQVNLEDVLCNLPLEVIQRSNRVVVRLQGVTKTLLLDEIMKQFRVDRENKGQHQAHNQRSPPPKLDFVFYAGNGVEDTELFTYFKKHMELARKDISDQNATTATTDASSSGFFTAALSKQANVFTCHVGSSKTEAMFYLERPSDLARMLRALAVHSRDGSTPKIQSDQTTSTDLTNRELYASASMPSLLA